MLQILESFVVCTSCGSGIDRPRLNQRRVCLLCQAATLDFMFRSAPQNNNGKWEPSPNHAVANKGRGFMGENGGASTGVVAVLVILLILVVTGVLFFWR